MVVIVALIAASAVAIVRETTAPSAVTVFAVNAGTDTVGPVLRDGVQSLHRPNSISFDSSSLWQSTAPTNGADGGTLVRRDPMSGAIETTRIVPTGDAVRFAFGSAWTQISGDTSSQLLKIDPASGRTLATIALPGSLVDAQAGDRSIWALSASGDLVEIDPRTAKIVEHFMVDAGDPTTVVPLTGSIWICDRPNGRILQVDPADGTVLRTLAIPQRAYLIGVATDADEGNTLWLVDADAGTITPLDPTTGEPGGPLGVGGFGGSRVYAAEIGFGSIWVAAGSKLFRFDLPDGARHVIPVPDGASAGGLALDETRHIVWVENCGCSDS